ncbi:unnamed protein product [Darwinula stevensoni]|uniref:Myotrophin n=1 Tax=Darwinula stevensoni TaxID=69355 RepID=A0A7R9AFS6_9CRUS|nr:unnamed protein product [Darwinula stevensoni]CAD7253438.1 unnamed protein product [Darwinula stevensoni]CAG0900308.1 unnamed protein product [Darwinula stevensoni]CAG0903586.1 unnamed protein product [Darwinula stevensoni]
MSDFVWALKNGDLEQVKEHVEKAKDKHGISALLAAIWEGHTDCVKLLLQHGANKSGSTPDGISYLEAAEKEDIRALLI